MSIMQTQPLGTVGVLDDDSEQLLAALGFQVGDVDGQGRALFAVADPAESELFSDDLWG